MKTEGIVLHALRYDDTSRIVNIYTAAEGMVPFMVRGGARKHSSMKAALLQPLTQVCVDFDMRPAKKIQSLRDVHLSVPYTSLPFNMHKRAIVMFLSEVLQAVLRGEEGNAQLLHFITTSLQWLDLAEERYSNFHLFFLLRLLRYLGFDPAHHPDAESWHLPLLLRFDYRSMHLLRLTAAQRREFMHMLLSFYADNIPSFPEIHSADVLHDIYLPMRL